MAPDLHEDSALKNQQPCSGAAAASLKTIRASRPKKTANRVQASQNAPVAYLLSATYEGERHAACLKFYEPETRKLVFWYDNTGHKPYCLSDLPAEKLEKIEALRSHQGLDCIETVEKCDPLQFKTVRMSKIIAKDPLSIGGRPSGSIRDIIPRAWEANIRYHECYIYDRQLSMGMPYRVAVEGLTPVEYNPPSEVSKSIDELFKDEEHEFKEYVDNWVKLFQCQIPRIRRAAIDIEVFSPIETRIPNPEEAKEKIIAASIVDSDGNKRILTLKRQDMTEADESCKLNIEFFKDEKEIIAELFKVLLNYPIILTFNGDDFDLRYIYHRAINLGFAKEEIPLSIGTRSVQLKYGAHLDLYRFFFNKSIQVYAFSRKYIDMTLSGISEALIGLGKVERSKPISELSYAELSEYCLRDSEITLQLTTFDDELVMRLIILLARISKLSIEDLTREGVSSWIKSIMYYEHRRLNYLIPRSEDVLRAKGEAATAAIIRGKKYKGAIVVDPKPGVHFDVAVLDFASLYPSIIKVYNLSYETILCPHPECRSNKIPDLSHWVCRLNKGLSSLIIGSLRDMRVRWYKKKAKELNDKNMGDQAIFFIKKAPIGKG